MIKVRLFIGIILLSLLTVLLGACILETDSEPSSETTKIPGATERTLWKGGHVSLII